MKADQEAGFDLDRIRDETFVSEVRYHPTTGSTNDTALELCRQELPCTPLLVLAGEQTAGRGRGANRWWSARGALTFSLVIDPVERGLAECDWPRASLTTGLAVCLALRELLPENPSQLKWPNDVFLENRKVSGTLNEVGPPAARPLILGIGVNVNNSFQDAPQSLRTTAVSLVDVTGERVDLTTVLVAILLELEVQLRRLAENDPELASAWRKCCYLTGKPIEIVAGSQPRSGVCQGIDAGGALLLSTGDGTERHFSGTVRIRDQTS